MRGALAYILAALMVAAGAWAATAEQPANTTVRFAAVDVLIDTGETPLAAYQLDLRATSGNVRIVGIEGGAHPAFADPPYYDPAAIQGDRVIIGAFNTAPGDSLPTGTTRIATIHVQITGDKEAHYNAELTIVATADGVAIPGRLILNTEPER